MRIFGFVIMRESEFDRMRFAVSEIRALAPFVISILKTIRGEYASSICREIKKWLADN